MPPSLHAHLNQHAQTKTRATHNCRRLPCHGSAVPRLAIKLARNADVIKQDEVARGFLAD